MAGDRHLRITTGTLTGVTVQDGRGSSLRSLTAGPLARVLEAVLNRVPRPFLLHLPPEGGGEVVTVESKQKLP